MIEAALKELTIDYLKETGIADNLQRAAELYQKAQEIAIAYVNDDSPENLKQMRIGTVLVFALLSKVAAGKTVKAFTQDDWKDIVAKVSDYAIFIDPKQYSIGVFSVYANYIDMSVKVLLDGGAPEDKCANISGIAHNIREMADELQKGNISESRYTEECLWLSLEAMIKLICAFNTAAWGSDIGEFAESVAILAFEYGRYTLYKQEQALLTEYLDHQSEVDDELNAKFAGFCDDMQARRDEFEDLIKSAFSQDIKARLKSTIDIARNAGVDEAEILDSTEKIDDFFL